MDDALAGRLLVSTHDLTDRNFRHAVVLLLAHAPRRGAAGVVLNRPTGSDPPARLAAWRPLSAPPVMFRGGPVSPDAVIGVAVATSSDARPAHWQRVDGAVGVVDLTADPAPTRADLTGLRLFVGYAGWEAGQLEDEISAGAWFVVPAEPADVLTAAPAALWRSVLARQGGLFTTVPFDPELN